MPTHPPIIAGTIVRFMMRADINGRACDNMVDVSLDEVGEGRATAVASITGPVTHAWQANVIPALGSWYRFHVASWIDLDSLEGLTGDTGPQSGDPVLGGTGGAQHPPNTAALIHKNVDRRRNTRSGRMYLSPLTEADTDDGGTLAGSTITRLQTAMDHFKLALEDIAIGAGSTTTWRVVHVIGHGPPAPGFPQGVPNEWDSSDVNTTTVDAIAATQRRRLRG